MRTAIIYFLIFGVGAGGLLWFVLDYIRHLRAQLARLQRQLRELEDRNAELVLALEDRRDAAEIDKAIRQGRIRE